MTDSNGNGPELAPGGPVDKIESDSGVPGTPHPGNGPEGASSASGNGSQKAPDPADTFPREYVENLRKESKGYRTRSQQMAQKLVHSIASRTGRLADPTDLPVTDDLMDEDG